MNSYLKNAFWAAATIALLAGAFALVSYAQTYSKAIDPSSTRSFSVTGQGKVTSAPDIAQFSLSVVTEGGKALKAIQDENTTKMNNAIEFLKLKNIDSKDIATQAYLVTPRHQYFDCSQQVSKDGGGVCPPPEIVGYTVQQSAIVKVRDFSVIGDLLSGVVDKGANSVSQLSFTVDDPTALENEAREEAIRNAQDKAESVARAGDFRLGRLLAINEGGLAGQPYAYYSMTEADYGKGGAAPAPSIEPGSRDVTVNVSLVYEIR